MVRPLAEDEREQALDHADIGPAILAAQGLRVSPAQFERLHHFVVRARDDEVHGLLRRPVPRGTFASFVRLATQLPTVRSLLIAGNEIYGLFDRGAPWTVETGQSDVVLGLAARRGPQTESLLFTLTMLLSPWRTSAWLCGESLSLLEVGLDRRFGAFTSEARYLFGVSPRLVAGRSYLRFDRAELELPLRRSRDEADEWVRTASYPSLLAQPPRRSLESRVRLALSQDPTWRLGLADVAEALGMARATLARHLRADGTSFRQLRDELRRDRAVNLLSQGHSVAEVAEGLGFSEASAFQRAFKGWTGSTPGEVRRARPPGIQ